MSKQSIETRIGGVYGAGGDTARLAAAYDAWAEGYDADVAALGYRYPVAVAGMAGRHIPEGIGPILDAGAGTGLMGEVLALLGHDDLVALDLSPGMLEMAAAKGVYRETLIAILGGPLDLESDRFAAMVCAGTLTTGHAPPDCLDELVRVVRPGGTLLFTVSDGALEAGFGNKIDALQVAGRWERMAATAPFKAMPGAETEANVTAQVFAYRKT